MLNLQYKLAGDLHSFIYSFSLYYRYNKSEFFAARKLLNGECRVLSDLNNLHVAITCYNSCNGHGLFRQVEGVY